MKTAHVGKLLVVDSLLISCGLVCEVSLFKCLMEYTISSLALTGALWSLDVILQPPLPVGRHGLFVCSARWLECCGGSHL